jgi:hypothetical protein
LIAGRELGAECSRPVMAVGQRPRQLDQDAYRVPI